MKRASAWAGLVLFGIWLTSSAIANPGRAFYGAGVSRVNFRGGGAFRNSALVRDATASRGKVGWRHTALIRDATGRGPLGGEWRSGRYAYRYGYGYGYGYGYYRDRYDRRRDRYRDGAGYYDYATPYDSGYFDPYLYPGGYNSYPYAPGYGDQTEAPDTGYYAPENGSGGTDTAPPVRTGTELVSAVQNKLARQAYYDGTLGGVINEETRRAIREYQKDHGMPVTGLISPDLLFSMAIRYVSPLM